MYYKCVTYSSTVLVPPLCPPGRNGFPWPFVAVIGLSAGHEGVAEPADATPDQEAAFVGCDWL